MRAVAGFGLLGLLLVLPLVGCADKPEITYERQIEMRELAADVAAVDNAYELLESAGSTGRFGCGLAIGKLAAGEAAEQVRLAVLTPAEEGYWTQTTAVLPRIRHAQFLSPAGTFPRDSAVDVLCKKAASLDAGLLLLYAPNRYGLNSAQVLGVLYDVTTGKPIASLHASATFIDDETGLETPPDYEKGDKRGTDAVFQSARAFERYVQDCLVDLINRDKPAPPTEPKKWRTPPEQRWWLPYQRPRG